VLFADIVGFTQLSDRLGTIQVTERTYERLRDNYELRERDAIDIKGKGPMTTYVLVGPRRRAQGARRDPRKRATR
jgi:class 3 adenylate cyclase